MTTYNTLSDTAKKLVDAIEFMNKMLNNSVEYSESFAREQLEEFSDEYNVNAEQIDSVITELNSYYK